MVSIQKGSRLFSEILVPRCWEEDEGSTKATEKDPPETKENRQRVMRRMSSFRDS